MLYTTSATSTELEVVKMDICLINQMAEYNRNAFDIAQLAFQLQTELGDSYTDFAAVDIISLCERVMNINFHIDDARFNSNDYIDALVNTRYFAFDPKFYLELDCDAFINIVLLLTEQKRAVYEDKDGEYDDTEIIEFFKYH